MRLKVDHVTRYRYDRTVRAVLQSHRLTPSVCDGQKVIEWAVTVTGGLQGGAFRDGAGDRVQGWTVQGPVEEVVVTVTGIVDTVDMAGMLKGLKETVSPQCYLRDTDLTAPDKALRRLADGVRADQPLDLAHGLAAAVSGAIAWRAGATGPATTAAQALEQGAGVCQDHAHALIALARHRGIPARYVAGYLGGEDGGEGAAQEAAHAWAELNLPGLGWIGFDPANRCCPDARYIRLGSGFDAQDAAPIRGVARGAGAESMDVSVAVRALQMQGQSQQ